MADHLHLDELPGWLAKRGSDISECRDEVTSTISSLQYNHDKVLTSANHARFLIREITSNSGLVPEPQEVYDSVQEFVYHYENYCLRVYILREKTLLYMNSALGLGYTPRTVKVDLIKMNPIVKKSGLLSAIDKFDSSKSDPLGKLIKRRRSLTHQISRGIVDPLFRPEEGPEDIDFSEWCKKWPRNILTKSKEVDAAQIQTSSLNHLLAEKVIAYREPLRPSNQKKK